MKKKLEEMGRMEKDAETTTASFDEELNREIALLEKDIELMRKILEYNSDLVMVDCKDGLRADDEHIKAYEVIRANLIAYKNLIIRGVFTHD